MFIAPHNTEMRVSLLCVDKPCSLLTTTTDEGGAARVQPSFRVILGLDAEFPRIPQCAVFHAKGHIHWLVLPQADFGLILLSEQGRNLFVESVLVETSASGVPVSFL
ncbi:hypothetical protein DM793_03970 [Paenarthrobacter nitroguajacolicus]|nr:hypothetical protein [Paenarthrobacter nitroguajacolicus]